MRDLDRAPLLVGTHDLAFPGQTGFIGGSMGDWAVVVEGVDSELARRSLRSTVHGAGRVMSRSKAKGNRKGTRKGLITRQMMAQRLNVVELAVDERRLVDVAAPHLERVAGLSAELAHARDRGRHRRLDKAAR